MARSYRNLLRFARFHLASLRAPFIPRLESLGFSGSFINGSLKFFTGFLRIFQEYNLPIEVALKELSFSTGCSYVNDAKKRKILSEVALGNVPPFNFFAMKPLFYGRIILTSRGAKPTIYEAFSDFRFTKFFKLVCMTHFSISRSPFLLFSVLTIIKLQLIIS